MPAFPTLRLSNPEVNTDDVKGLKVRKVGMPPLFGDAVAALSFF
jgi:hypothetical protein